MMYIAGETLEPSTEAVILVEGIIRDQVHHMVSLIWPLWFTSMALTPLVVCSKRLGSASWNSLLLQQRHNLPIPARQCTHCSFAQLPRVEGHSEGHQRPRR